MQIFKINLRDRCNGSPYTGDQTQITPFIKELSDFIPGEGFEYVDNVGRYIHSMNVLITEKPDFRRNADTILNSTFYAGPHEAGVAYAALLRARGMDVEYIQTVDCDEVRALSTVGFFDNARVYLKVHFEDYEFFVDSLTGQLLDNIPDNMVALARGLDAWDIGLRDGLDDLRHLFISTVSSGAISTLQE